MAHNPIVGTGTYFASANGVTTSQPFSVRSDSLRVTAVGSVDINVAIGTNPTATDLDYVVVADTSATLSLTPKSQPVSGITTGTSTTYHFPEGTGTTFNVGDTVTITGITPDSLNGTHLPIERVLTSASHATGYYSTRVVVTKDTSSSTVSGASTATFNGSEMRNSLKVSAKASGTGTTVQLIQVQTSGIS